jgi:macrolide-specific efflux system membrane fusion protein
MNGSILKTLSALLSGRSRFVTLLLLLAGILFGLYGWASFTSPQAQPVRQLVERGDVIDEVLATGKLSPRTEVDVGAQISGQLQKIFVQEGDVVKMEQPLALIDRDIMQNTYDQALASFQVIEAQVRASDERLSQAARDLNRYRALRGDIANEKRFSEGMRQYQSAINEQKVLHTQLMQAKDALELARRSPSMNDQLRSRLHYNKIAEQVQANVAQIERSLSTVNSYKSNQTSAISEKDFTDSLTNYNVSQAEHAQLLAELKKAKIAVETAQKNLTFAQILAPINGTVMEIVSREGQTLIASLQAPVIMKIADLSHMTVEVKVSEADILKIKPGYKVTFSVFGEPDFRYHSTIDKILPSPEMNNNSVYYNVLFSVDNEHGQLKKNMTANVSIITQAKYDVAILPAALLPEKASTCQVNVLTDKALPERRTITLGERDSKNAEIVAGLQPGEVIDSHSVTQCQLQEAQ